MRRSPAHRGRGDRIEPPVLCAAALLFMASGIAPARGIAYGAVSDARVQRCDTLQWSGHAAQAQGCYRDLVTGTDAAARAEGAWALGDFNSANDWFRQASAAQPQSAALRVRWGQLYVDSHQNQDALDLFKEALQRDPRNAYAKVGAATVLADQFESEAARYIDAVQADERAPAGARLQALLLATRVALEDSDLSKGAALLERAGALASQAAMPQLEVYALKAALDLLNGKDDGRWINAALKDDANYGDAYAVAAHFCVITRQYERANALYRKAIEVQPNLWSAQVELASGLLRENRVAEAREHLQLAYRGDPYDPITSNTLKLLDSFDQFDLLTYEDRAGSHSSTIMLRISKKESAVLAPYAHQLAQRAIATYSERYAFHLQQPVVIEIYPNHEDFAVRTAGMPGIGLLGVTFGYVLAMDSPSSRPENEFHWGTTLWHEMAHVFTLESTAHRVPRWLSEGLSVFEEWNTGPIKGREIPEYAYDAFRNDKALPVADLDRGFIRPEYPQQVVVSYMQAGLICDFINSDFGFERLRALLQQYAHTSDTAAAIQGALGISAAQFDARFKAYLTREFGALFRQFDTWRAARDAANAAAARADWAAADRTAEQALAIEPQDVEDGSAYIALAQAQLHSGQADAGMNTLLSYWRRGGHEPGALKQLATQLGHAARTADAIAVLQSVNYVAPFDYGVHGQLGDWLLDANRPDAALEEYRIAYALDPPDAAQAHYRLARAQFALNAWAEARTQVLAALEIAPNYKPAQQLLLQLAHNSH
jgi:tetratricopeptide (TPR) repeat protein